MQRATYGGLPIAQHRFVEIDGPTVKFRTKDTITKETVLDEFPKEEFVRMLADQVPERYCHSVRYFGLLAPRARIRAFAFLFKLLGQIRRPLPPHRRSRPDFLLFSTTDRGRRAITAFLM